MNKRSFSHHSIPVTLLSLSSLQTQNRSIATAKLDDAPHFEDVMGRPFTLPPGQFKPKQSLGQNFLTDQNYVRKIVESLKDTSDKGSRVVEIGPGLGALTRLLFPKYQKMRAIEIDQRAIEYLSAKIPELQIIHMDALNADWAQLAADRGGRLNVIGNLPYYIVSQILFSLVDHHRAIDQGVFTMQLEVAERLTAKQGNKHYGIPSVVFQLYSTPKLCFKIPPTVFYPVPKVDSALVSLDFSNPHPALKRVNLRDFRRVVNAAFNQRRKMLRQSLKDITVAMNVKLPSDWEMKRPDQLSPVDFIQLTVDIYGEALPVDATKIGSSNDEASRDYYASEIVWRRSVNVKNDVSALSKD